MDISKWKSVAVEKDSYLILQALCKHGYRKPGAMISKLVNDMVSKVAKKEGKSAEHMRKQLLAEGKELKG
jgi:hypothetical protein